MNKDLNHTVLIKTPYKFIWSFAAITVLIVQILSIWEPDTAWLSDTAFWIIWAFIMSVAIYSICLFLRYYNRTYAKKLVVDADGNTTVTFQLVRWLGVRSYDSAALNIKTRKNTLRLQKDGKTIVKIYKNSLSDPNDWDWMIHYYKQ